MEEQQQENRKYVIAAIALVIVVVYTIRLFTLQLLSDDYKKNADSNALFKKVSYPARGNIRDRKGKLLVYNQPSYDILVTMHEEAGRLDTMDFCNTLGITREYFDMRMAEIKDRTRNPGYSKFTRQLFMTQLTDKEYSLFREKLFRFPGFYIRKRSIRQYAYPYAAHILGDVAEVSKANLEEDNFYQAGDYIGKQGIEKSYEKQLRGEKGVEIYLRDAHGQILDKYMDGALDRGAKPGKDLTLSIDLDLQALGEKLLEGKFGSIVAIDPKTGEILCLVSSPTYDPRMMCGKTRGKNLLALAQNAQKPLLNRAIMGQYPPGSTFKTTQALTFMQEGIINSHTLYPCYHGFSYRGLHIGCHGHHTPINLIDALTTSCNSYFCWGLFQMLSNRRSYHNVQESMNKWRDYMVSMGFGYKLGIDLPGEKRGLIPNAKFYDKAYKKRWNGLTVISISIGQGEVTSTPLQIANLAATIANRGYFYTPHVVKEIKGEPLDTLYTHRRYTMASRRHYDYVVAGMRSAVARGTCTAANIPGYEVCGKTGTAQNRGRDHSIFMGFAPMYNPRIAISVYVENAGFGAHVAVPIGATMIRKYLSGNLAAAETDKNAEDNPN